MSVAAPRTVANRAAGTRAPGAGTTPAAPGFPPAFVSSGPTAAATRAAPAPTPPMVQTCQTPSQDFMTASRTSTAQDESRPLERAESTTTGDKGRGSIRPFLRLLTNVQRSCSSSSSDRSNSDPLKARSAPSQNLGLTLHLFPGLRAQNSG